MKFIVALTATLCVTFPYFCKLVECAPAELTDHPRKYNLHFIIFANFRIVFHKNMNVLFIQKF